MLSAGYKRGGVACDFIIWDIGICKDFTLCEIDEVPLILEDTFFESDMVDVRRKKVCL
jgi:hypothetical protein